MNRFENGFDSYQKAILELEKRSEDEFKLKAVIINFHHSIEVLFKHILYSKSKCLIYRDINNLVSEAFDRKIGKKNNQKEKGQKSYTESMEGICRYLPALIRAQKVQSKASKVGFDWDSADGALDKLKEEVGELTEAAQAQNADDVCEELGDVLFSAVNVARFFNCSAEESLGKTIRKFINRFSYVEASAQKAGKQLENMTLQEMDALWEKAKQQSRSSNEN